MIPANRTYWYQDDLQAKSKDGWLANENRTQVFDPEDANLVGSRLLNDKHAPALDIDLPCELVESSTPGHFHLYIDKQLTWPQYRRLLTVLSDVGIIEYGYYRASTAAMQTFLRKPGQKK